MRAVSFTTASLLAAALLASPPGLYAQQSGQQAGANRDAAERETRAQQRPQEAELNATEAGRDSTIRTTQGMPQEAQNQGKVVRVEKWIGTDVRDRQNEKIGEIRDFAIDPQQGRVVYFVMEANDQLHALPLQAFQPSVQDTVILGTTADKLKQLKGFDEDADWPRQANTAAIQTLGLNVEDSAQMGQQQRSQQQQGQMQQQAMHQQAGQQNAQLASSESMNWQRRASNLTGADVRTGDDKEVGKLQDLVVNHQNGDLIYGIVSHDNGTSLVPWQALSVDAQQKALTLSADAKALDQTAFKGDKLPDLTDEDHIRRTHQAFGIDVDVQTFGFADPGPNEDLPADQRNKPGMPKTTDDPAPRQ